MRLPTPSLLRLRPCASTLLGLFIGIALWANNIHVSADDSVTIGDHGDPRLSESRSIPEVLQGPGSGHGNFMDYEPEFHGLDRSIIGRAASDIETLGNNAPGKSNIQDGESQFWTFPKTTLLGPQSPATPGLPSNLTLRDLSGGQDDEDSPDLRKRQGDPPTQRMLYISFNTCNQPAAKVPNPKASPAQLELYISTDSSNQKPSASSNTLAVPIEGGFGWVNVSVSGDVFFGVSAPTDDQFSGNYNYEITASIDGFYASYYNETNMRFQDSDNHSALLYTNDTTTANSSAAVQQEWMHRSPAFSLFVQNQDNTATLGLQNSMCALHNYAQIQGTNNINASMTSSGSGQPKQQFYVTGLNASSVYSAITGIIGNSTRSGGGIVNGGGTVWKSASFSTKSAPNCALAFNLTFCSDVAYAVPSNATNGNDPVLLGQVYDNFTSLLYTNFSKSLAQIPCNTTSTARYSLARTCTDCANAYKQWLCAVTIPRCEDWSNPAPYLQPRAVNHSFINDTYGTQFQGDPIFSTANKSAYYYSSSRNSMIDSVIAPGPYKEVLPCQDLCYELVQSCPAALQFACPLQNYGLNYSYGSTDGAAPGEVKCNFPGTVPSLAAPTNGFGIFATIVALGTTMTLVVI